MKKIIAIFLSVWTTVSVFSSNDFTPPEPQPEPEYIYKFEPDAESPGAEVAPLEVNKKDEDVPNQLPSSSEQTMPQFVVFLFGNNKKEHIMQKHKVIVWDLDNTLYRETPEFHDLLDEITAKAAIEDLKLPLNFAPNAAASRKI